MAMSLEYDAFENMVTVPHIVIFFKFKPLRFFPTHAIEFYLIVDCYLEEGMIAR
jgi:hypothetical protein